MLTSRALLVSFLAAVVSTAGFAQATPAPQNPLLGVPPPPSDVLELATVAHEVPNTLAGRNAVLDLIQHARQNADIRTAGAPPFTMRVSFSASGDVLYTGSGETEDTWVSWESSRWSARLGDFSFTRIWDKGVPYDDKPISLIPLRLQMLRDAMFWPVHASPDAHLRTATANWKGKQVTCVLAAGDGIQAQETIGRRWVEREYCIEPKTGQLQILSEAPGIYVVYDYTGAVDFHGHIVPRQITIFEGGKNVLVAHVDSIADLGTAPSGLLTPSAEMVRQGPVLSMAMRFPQVVPVAPGAAAMQPVIVHALLAEDGKVLDAELVDDSGAELQKTALNLVKHSTYRAARPGSQLQREAFINVKFISR
jgi:Gram-negative bacterial TonB protein C-terminal